MKFNWKSITMLLVIVLAVVLAVSAITNSLKNDDEFVFSDLIELFDDDLVVSYEVDEKLVINVKALKPLLDEDGNYIRNPDNSIAYEEKDGKTVYQMFTFQLGYNFQLERLNEIAEEKLKNPESTNLESYNYVAQKSTPLWYSFIPHIVVLVLVVGLWFFLMRQAPGSGKMNNFAKSRAKLVSGDRDAVKFADVAGADEEKAELEEVVEFLKDPAKFVKLGARIPRGVLLVGPPGTGKTLLAKAVAGEAGVPFFSISGSDFVEMYVGVGASRVRDLFDSARRAPASIIFIDEIDAVGRHRGAGLGGGHDEREQTLNQLLVEMDGFGTNSGVIVMAATNRPDILDPALLRPGRFDRRVTVNYPDMSGREAILKVHCRNKPLEASVDLRKIAQTTIGFTGAELANLMNEAALHAAKNNKALVGMDDIEESFMKLLLGPQKKTRVRRDSDNKLCAYHEAGHAVAAYYAEHSDPVKHITIIPAGNTGGVTLIPPTEDRMGASRNEMLDDIVVSLGGRVAEALVLDDISTGASSDIQKATSIATNMVTRYGMSTKLGTVLYGSKHSEDEIFLGRDFSSSKNYSEKTAAEIDDEIRAIISDSYNRCEKILSEHIDKLHFVAEFLLKNEFMDEEQFNAAMESDNPTIEDIENIANEKKSKSAEENKTAHENNAKAEEEARIKAEEEAKKMAEETFGAAGDYSTDDFFKNIFKTPDEEEQKDDSTDTDKTDTNKTESDN